MGEREKGKGKSKKVEGRGQKAEGRRIILLVLNNIK